MSKLSLMIGIHSHQPEGNFGHVFDMAYEMCYRPFLDTLERFPLVKVSLHYSGVLLTWFEEKQPDFLDRLARLVQKGQVEMLGGGFYEPVLAMIPEEDAIGK